MIRNLLFIAALFLLSCNENKTAIGETTSAVSDTLLRKDKADTASTNSTKKAEEKMVLQLSEFGTGGSKMVQPVTFSEICPVYAKPKTLSKVIGRLKFNSPLKPTADSLPDWLEIEYGDRKGYIKRENMVYYSFSSLVKDKKVKYFIRNSEIYKFDFTQNRFIDTFQLADFHPDFNPEYFQQLNSSKWKNVDLFLKISSYAGCCGCSDNQIYLVDANGKLETIFKTSQYIDDGEIEAGYETGISLPLDPQVDSIVYHEREYGALLDKKGNAILDKKGLVQTGTIKEIYKYYKWNGVRIVEP
jgi:hypothetical protein